MFKRAIKRKTCEDSIETKVITPHFLEDCNKKFKSDPLNIVAQNAITSVGSLFATMNANRTNEISHVFLNSIKRKGIKATNQGASGRCWMFAALNIFRHSVINALELESFEFSETYLYFYDKLERANSYLSWFIENPNESLDSRAVDYMLSTDGYLSDGGWWNTFANLVEKYGLVPKSAMKETFQSGDSEDMNRIIKIQLDACVNHIRKNREKIDLLQVKNSCLENIYSTLVKFLGEPPKKFNWSFETEEDEKQCITNLDPLRFKNTVLPDVKLHEDYVVLANIPSLNYYQNYTVKNTKNVYEGKNCTIFNVPINELKRYVLASLSKGMGVWFVADVRDINLVHATLDDKLDNSALIFPELYKFEKRDRILLRNTEGNHAMLITGFNVDHNKVTSYQVENSWGFIDEKEKGEDGFLFMSDSFFEKYVIQIVVHKEFLSRKLKREIQKETVLVEPWDCLAPALRSK